MRIYHWIAEFFVDRAIYAYRPIPTQATLTMSQGQELLNRIFKEQKGTIIPIPSDKSSHLFIIELMLIILPREVMTRKIPDYIGEWIWCIIYRRTNRHLSVQLVTTIIMSCSSQRCSRKLPPIFRLPKASYVRARKILKDVGCLDKI